MNKVILMGRLVKEPEVRYSQGAEPIAVARYTLAVNRRFKRQGEPEADFINCVAFGKTGEFAEKYFKKGSWLRLPGGYRCGAGTRTASGATQRRLSLRSSTLRKARRTAEKAKRQRHRADPQRHPISLQSRWGWRSRRGSIRLMKALKMMICRSEE